MLFLAPDTRGARAPFAPPGYAGDDDLLAIPGPKTHRLISTLDELFISPPESYNCYISQEIWIMKFMLWLRLWYHNSGTLFFIRHSFKYLLENGGVCLDGFGFSTSKEALDSTPEAGSFAFPSLKIMMNKGENNLLFFLLFLQVILKYNIGLHYG